MANEPPVSNSPGVTRLPDPRFDGNVSVESTMRRRRSVRDFARTPLALAEVSQLLWSAQGFTDPEGKRTAPSAGALYPLEAFLVTGKESGLPAGVYRYRPRTHDLLLVAEGDKRAKLASAALDQEFLAEAPVTIALAAVYERTARKYRQRAERYVHMEIGHAAQNIHLQALALGFGTVVVGAFDDAAVKQVLSLAPNEQPLCLMPVGKSRPEGSAGAHW